MELLTLKCKECGNKVNKINKFQDIFLIKKGKAIVCKQCHTKYAVPKIIQKIGSIYHYLFIGGLIAIIWLFLTVFIDNMLGKEISNIIGIWMWAISAVVYILIEMIITLVLPLKKIKNEE